MHFKKYFPILIFIFSSLILQYTSYPSIGWWDSSFYVDCAYNLGLPVPGGSILYVLIGRLFTIVFFFFPPVKAVTLVSIVSISLSAICFYYTLSFLLIRFEERKNLENINENEENLEIYFISFITALSIPFLYSIWCESNVSRVYTLGLLLTSIIILCAVIIWFKNDDDKKIKLFLLLVFLISIDFSSHRLNTPFIPVLFILLIFPLRRYLFDYKFWGLIILIYITGFSIHLYLLFRAQVHPLPDLGNTETWKGLFSWLNMERFVGQSNLLDIFKRNAPLWDYQINFMYIRYFLWNFYGKVDTIFQFSILGGIPLLLGILGFLYNIKRNFKSWILLLIIFIFYSIVLILYQNIREGFHNLRDIDRIYIPSFFIFTFWIGVGFYLIYKFILKIFLKMTSKRSAMHFLIIIGFLIIPLNIIIINWKECNKNKFYSPVDFAYNLLSSCEKDAVLFTNGDNDTFPLWYLQNVEGYRKDICVANLSLLNANFYVKQLINEPFSLPVDSSIKNIDNISLTLIEKELIIKIPPSEFDVNTDDTLIFIYKGRNIHDKKIMFVQDKVLISFLRENRWKRPIYFAITVSPANYIGLQDYISNTGINYRLLPIKDRKILPEISEKNLTKIYRYRYFDNPEVQIDRGTILTYNNFRNAFCQLIEFYINTDQKEKAKNTYKYMKEKLPDWRFIEIPNALNESVKHINTLLENIE